MTNPRILFLKGKFFLLVMQIRKRLQTKKIEDIACSVLLSVCLIYKLFFYEMVLVYTFDSDLFYCADRN